MDFTCEFTGDAWNAEQVFDLGFFEGGQAAELTKQEPPSFTSNPGDVFKNRMQVFTPFQLPLELDGKTMGFITDVLKKIEFWRVSVGTDFIFHLRFNDVFKILKP